MDKNSKIYVAGHKGLVGSAIWNKLIEKGYTNLIGYSHSELDLEDSVAVTNFFENEKPEYVFLAAAFVGGIMANNRFRGDFILKNLQIQNNVIGSSLKYSVKKLLFLGSTCIYPKDAPQPIKEEALLIGPLEYTNEPYAIAKIAGLKLCESLNLQYDTNFISVMPTNLYGPGDNFSLKNSHVLPAMIRKIHLAKCLQTDDWKSIMKDLKKRPDHLSASSLTVDIAKQFLAENGISDSGLTLWGTGTPLREFLWSEDMAEASIFVMNTINAQDLVQGMKEPRNMYLNVGSEKEISIAELARLIAGTIGYTGKINFDSSKPDGTMRKLTDSSKIKSYGWQPTVELEEGIDKLYQWYLRSIG